MNQQRSRRFRASKESTEKIKELERIREELLMKGCELPPPKPKEEHFDSNCITPVRFFQMRTMINSYLGSNFIVLCKFVYREPHLWTDCRSACTITYTTD